MPSDTLQDLFSRLQKPSRYLGTEINRIRKDPESVKLKVALAFPDLYDIGTSHFGVQILYHILNQESEIAAERVFAPGKDLEALLRQRQLQLFSLENHIPLNCFDIIGFSLLYELNYTNVLNMLDLAGLPLRWEQRDATHPLVVAGGPCVCNPEPMADFFDAMVFGDGELVVQEMAAQWLHWQSGGGKDRIDLLKQWSAIEGVYVPQFYRVRYDAQGHQQLTPRDGAPERVRRRVLSDLDDAPFPQQPVIPFGKPVHDRLRIEIARGCTRGCRFCQAGMIYRPVRERSPQKLFDLTRSALAETGYEDLSLLSLSTGDYGCLGPLMEAVMQHCQKDRVAVSLPSMRAGSLTPELMALIKSVRKTGFTIAPEAGSQRLRNVINKNICFDDVAATVQDAFGLGWKLIKLYFMIGLPGETQQDLEAIVDMVQRLKQIKGPQGRKGNINVSVTTFVPKSHTPFQWAGQISLAQSREKIAYLKEALGRLRGVRFKWQDPAMSQLEGALARGDRRVGSVLEEAWHRGCTFDGWSDHFNFGRWQESFVKCAFDLEQETSRPRDLNEPLPWDHMDSGVDNSFLRAQWQEALAGEVVDDCRSGNCHQCGVCDFETLKPAVHDNCALSVEPMAQPETSPHDQISTYWLVYQKMGPARLLGHLELNNLFGRAIRRACIPVAYSQGFHPMPKLSFNDPLPLGIESEAEQMRIKLTAPMDCELLMERVNPFLPTGLQLIECRRKIAGKKQMAEDPFQYCIRLKDGKIDAKQLEAFWSSDHWNYERIKPKGRTRTMDLRACIEHLSCDDGKTIQLVLKSEAPHVVRPLDVLVGLFNLSNDVIQTARITKKANWRKGQ